MMENNIDVESALEEIIDFTEDSNKMPLVVAFMKKMFP